MKYSAILAGLLASVALAAPSNKGPLRKRITDYQNEDCLEHGLHVIAAGGEYTTVGNLSLLETLTQDVLDLVPGSQLYQIGYELNQPAPEAIAQFRPVFGEHFTSYAQKCPNTKIVTLGYSVGAAIIMDNFCGAPTNPQTYGPVSDTFRPNLLANIVYGDLTFVSGERSSAGTCSSGQGIVPRPFPGKCYPFGRKTQSYCDVDDPQCCTPGGNPEIHFTYPGIYDTTATSWVKAKYNYYVQNKNSS